MARPGAPNARPAVTGPPPGMQQQLVNAQVPARAVLSGPAPGAGAPRSLDDARERDARERNKRMRTEPEPRRNAGPLSSTPQAPKPQAAQPTQPAQPVQPAPAPAATATPPGRKLNNTPAWMTQQPKPSPPPSAPSVAETPESTASASPLPPDWVELPIFYNTATGQCSWERPRLVVMAGNREL